MGWAHHRLGALRVRDPRPRPDLDLLQQLFRRRADARPCDALGGRADGALPRLQDGRARLGLARRVRAGRSEPGQRHRRGSRRNVRHRYRLVTRFEAVYYDGKTSMRRAVSVWQESEALRISGTEVDLAIPRDQVTVDAPLSGVARSLTLPGGGQLQTQDHAAI